MKLKFAPGAFKSKSRKRQREEPLSAAQAERVRAIVESIAPKAIGTRPAATFGHDRRLVSAAVQLGVPLAGLNRHQRHLLGAMINQPLTDDQRRQMLADAGD